MLTNEERYRIAKSYFSHPDNSVVNIAENTNISASKVRHVIKNDLKDGFLILHSSMNENQSYIKSHNDKVKILDKDTGIEYPSINRASIELEITISKINQLLKKPTKEYNLIRL